jgi:hypothetical protein
VDIFAGGISSSGIFAINSEGNFPFRYTRIRLDLCSFLTFPIKTVTGLSSSAAPPFIGRSAHGCRCLIDGLLM